MAGNTNLRPLKPRRGSRQTKNKFDSPTPPSSTSSRRKKRKNRKKKIQNQNKNKIQKLKSQNNLINW